MSRSTQNTHTAAHQMPSLADRMPVVSETLPVQHPGRVQAIALVTLLQHGEPPNELLTAWAITRIAGVYTEDTPGFQRRVLSPMLDEGLVERFAAKGDATWRLTAAGRGIAEAVRPLTHQTQVALPRSAPSSEPLPRGEYRCPRPGAYDFERCPSRMGNRLIYRDGTREVAA